MKHFVFGYGSLICAQSRAITAPTLRNVIAEPVIIDKIERTWSARVTIRQARSSTGEDSRERNPSSKPNSSSSSSSDGRDHIRGWTPMGVRFRQGAKCNGVLIHVDDEELMRFDVREAGYVRQRIDLADIHCHIDSEKLMDESLPLWPVSDDDNSSSLREQIALKNVKCSECRVVFEKAYAKRKQSGCSTSTSLVEDISVWVYVQSENFPAERDFPITQSYIDIIMRGCLSISHDFARRFLETTHGWWHDGQMDGNEHETNTTQILDYESKAEIGSIEKQRLEKHHTWVNDRHDPMYVRADSEYSLEKGKEIDELIKQHHPHALQRRVMSM
eukprot:CAMPEP_0183736512 /NCGR_PEP_ID=MMETSP0737-20130205/49474_1 /TAXON_ID=385413 /ORGANISM="Thalassiosira miniscula, Strain CCMP1093" /LENGTH=330 /DNA_ID=CAMNT_0025970529 /DNA_START=1 /DNA_END=993 /DNA_ORIENTATION=+